ncbi:MAG: hypothetical protein QOJ85_497 [Solirubrobacteraceae bacterium]|nr:hypothetical protein [Solirubrobacteraceae bacterium]
MSVPRTRIVVAVLLCGGLLGCGGSSKKADDATATFKRDLVDTGTRSAPLGQLLLGTLRTADRLSNQDVVARFTGFSTQFAAVRDELAALSPPAAVSALYRAYLADFGAISKDSLAVARGARASDATAARAAEDRLLRDLRAANRDAVALKRKLGIK